MPVRLKPTATPNASTVVLEIAQGYSVAIPAATATLAGVAVLGSSSGTAFDFGTFASPLNYTLDMGAF